MRYHAKFTNYIVPPELPIYVEFVTKGRHPANHIHDHNFTEVVLILSGEGLYELENTRCRIKKGDLLIVPPGLNHGYDQIETLELVNLTYEEQKLYFPLLDAYELPLFELFFPSGSRRLETELFTRPLLHLTDHEVDSTSQKLLQLQNFLRNPGNGNCFKAQGIFMEIISSLAEKENENVISKWNFQKLGSVFELMHSHFNRQITVDELAAEACTSTRSFLRQFKKATGGITPMEYLLNLRLQHGAKMLYSTDYSISEIAIMCGFCDSSHFSKCFTRRHRQSPRSYRKSRTPGQRMTSSASETLPKGALT